MSQYTEEKQRRKAALRQTRRSQRLADTAIEKIERRIFTMLKLKNIITREQALTLVPLFNDFADKVRVMERDLADFLSIVSI